MTNKRNKLIEPLFILFFLLTLFSFGQGSSAYINKGQNRQDEPLKLKVAAYNVEFSDKGTAEEIGLALKPFDFDVVCFVEAPGGDWVERVGHTMNLKYSVIGKYSTAGHKDKYKTILSRTPLSDYSEVLMTDTLHTATRALTEIGGRKIAIYSVHFPFGWRNQAHIDETTSKVSAFINYLKESPDDVIPLVMGDLNFVISSEQYKSPYYEMFTKLGMDVSWRDLDIDVTRLSSMVKFNPQNKPAGGVIDHIIYPTDKVKAIEGQIIELPKPLSDHKPIWALLEFK